MINFNKKDPVADVIRGIMEKELSPKQKKIAALAGDKKAIDALDLAALRAGKKPTSEETVEENAFDYTTPRKPEPNGGSGVKKGTRYGGSKQKDTPEQDEDKKKVNEGKQPYDNVPFDPPYNTTSSPAEVKDKSGAIHTPMSRAKHLARLAMGKMKKELSAMNCDLVLKQSQIRVDQIQRLDRFHTEFL